LTFTFPIKITASTFMAIGIGGNDKQRIEYLLDDSDGSWERYEYDEEGNQTYYEDSVTGYNDRNQA
jgi:hypothetical protein